MPNIVRLRAPDSMDLHKMDQQDIEKFVTAEAEKMLGNLPKDFRLVAVNAVSVDQLPRAAGVGVTWTRACCGSRAQIEEFTDPVLDDVIKHTANGADLTRHFESYLVVEDNRFAHISDADVKR